MRRRVDVQAVVAVGTYLFFIIFLLYFLVSGSYLQYVSPRSVFYIVFAILVFCIWVWSGLKQLFLSRYKINIQKYLILLVIGLAVVLPHEPLTEAEFSSGFIEANNMPNSEQAEGAKRLGRLRRLSDTAQSAEAYRPTLAGYDEAAKTITIGDKDFMLWLYEIIGHKDFFAGQKIVAKVYVLKNGVQKLAPGEFVSARLAMTCCLADVAPIGLITEYSEEQGLVENEWVVVSGTLFLDDYDGRQIMKIRAEAVEASDAPEVEYVYPY